MRKNLHYLLMILMSWMLGTAFAQGDNGFHVRFSVADATCYNNGKVVYALTDASGTVHDTLPPQPLQRLREVHLGGDLHQVLDCAVSCAMWWMRLSDVAVAAVLDGVTVFWSFVQPSSMS